MFQGEINVWTEAIRGILGRQRYSFASLLQAMMAKLVDEIKFLREQSYVMQGKTPPSKRTSYRQGWRVLKMKMQVNTMKKILKSA